MLLVHAAGDSIERGDPHAQVKIGGWASDAVIDLVANWMFHEGDDKWALLLRTATLWRAHGDLASAHLGGRTAVDLLQEATGLEPEDILALGFALAAHVMEWNPGRSQPLRLDAGLGMEPASIDAFVRLVAATPEQLAGKLASQSRSTWDFLPFESTPVPHLPDGYRILDESLLWERVTNGLYWFVFDHLKSTDGDGAALAWTRAWGDMVEAGISGDHDQAVLYARDLAHKVATSVDSVPGRSIVVHRRHISAAACDRRYSRR